MLLALEIAGDGKAEAGGNRGGGMAGAEGIVFAFGALGETGQPPALAQRAHAGAATGENLVRIGLMADVPDQLVARGVENIVQRHRQFNDTEVGAEMAARHGNDVDHFLAQFVGDGFEFAAGQFSQVGGDIHFIQMRCLVRNTHYVSPRLSRPAFLKAQADNLAPTLAGRSAYSCRKSRQGCIVGTVCGRNASVLFCCGV